MKLIVNIRQENSDYNANDPDSQKFNVNEQYEVEAETMEIEEDEAGVFSLYGDLDGEDFEYDLPDMYTVLCKLSTGEERLFAISNALVADVNVVEKSAQQAIRYNFILSGDIDIDTDLVVPMDGIFIHIKDFPEELLEEDEE